MEASVRNPLRRSLRLAEGILKALFTTSPTEATEVIVKDDGQIVVKPAKDTEHVGRDSRPTPVA